MRQLGRPLRSTLSINGNMEGFNGKIDVTWLRLQKECSLGAGWREDCWARREEGRTVKRLVVMLTRALVVGVGRDD